MGSEIMGSEIKGSQRLRGHTLSPSIRGIEGSYPLKGKGCCGNALLTHLFGAGSGLKNELGSYPLNELGSYPFTLS